MRAYAMRNKSPLKNKPMRLPGQALGEQIDKMLDGQAFLYLLAGFLPWLVVFYEWQRYFNPNPPRPVLFTVLAVFVTVICVYRLYRIVPEMKNRARGRSGEIVVGQFLERLRADGFEVFHDIPANGFNIDHVLVGPQGVFTVETKTIGKPPRGKAIVDYDGQQIQLNGVTLTRNPIEQAKAQSAWLSKLIQDRTGKRLFIKPIVVFPGWYVPEKVKDPHVLVLNEQRIIPFVKAHEQTLNPPDIQLIAAQLTQYITTFPNQ